MLKKSFQRHIIPNFTNTNQILLLNKYLTINQFIPAQQFFTTLCWLIKNYV